MKWLRDYGLFVVTIIALLAGIGLITYRNLNPIPEDQRAFTSDWKCRHYGEEKLCTRRETGGYSANAGDPPEVAPPAGFNAPAPRRPEP